MNAITSTELDRLYERQTDRMLDEIERRNDQPEVDEAIKWLKKARRAMEDVTEAIVAARDCMSGTSEEHRIGSMAYWVDCYDLDIGKTLRRLEKWQED